MSSTTRSMRRRTLLQAGIALGASQAIGAPFVIRALGDQPVKIGMVDPLTGVLSALGQSEVDGAKYATAEINKKNGILGRQVELLVEDSANDIGIGVQKTRTLIDRDQVNAIFGDVNSGTAYAMSQITNEKNVLHIVPGGHTDPITGTNCKWNVFRVCNTTTMDTEAVTPELVKKFGKKWFFVSPDYAYGHTLQDAFIKA
ncbi:MAG TPA: ABC transporter substrate-binding protein, partial [Xanthobacteraceae bacterium]|nr:ABC transporter substrate-binding protein [Xanthobacteraceae bacterium]